jgi:glutathione synthase/RimK-type ligase-like ATP-grasp enzyme
MMKKNILFINGVPDDRRAVVYEIDKNGVYKWQSIGSANVGGFLKNDLFDRSSVLFDTTEEQELPRTMISAVFNQISDADTHKITLKKADDFYKSISDKVPFFNPPMHVMNTTRDNIYRSLQGIDKLHVPKTVKIQPRSPSEIYDTVEKENFEFPVIFRQAGDHGGISTIKVDDKTEQFHAFPLDGREYYLTQFVEYKEDGLYRKHRLVVIGGEVYLRHVKFSDQWIVHHETQITNPEKLQKAAYKRFEHEIKSTIQPIIKEIYNRLKLDYFGMDCYIDKDMNILVFEINASMGIFLQAKGDIFKDHLKIIREALIKMIVEKNTPGNLLCNHLTG